MMRWVVTGPLGAGKSAFTAHLKRRGALIIDGDRLGHEVLERPAILAAIRREFGPSVITAEAVDRAALGRLVFADPSALLALNRITHPDLSALADERLAEAVENGQASLAVLEAAVYFLWPDPPAVDLVIAVLAAEEVRLARLGRRGLDPASARVRLRAQEHLAPLWAQGQEIVRNEGSLADLGRAADRLLARYLENDQVPRSRS